MSSREAFEHQRLIVNADDFGSVRRHASRPRSSASRQARCTSATVMPGMPATDRALEFARAHPELGFGVHLTLMRGPGRVRSPTLSSSRASYEADGTLLSTREVGRGR